MTFGSQSAGIPLELCFPVAARWHILPYKRPTPAESKNSQPRITNNISVEWWSCKNPTISLRLCMLWKSEVKAKQRKISHDTWQDTPESHAPDTSFHNHKVLYTAQEKDQMLEDMKNCYIFFTCYKISTAK